jgi:hypothetical protein
MINFFEELKKLMLKHDIERITPVNMDAYLDTSDEIFGKCFHFKGSKVQKYSEGEQYD